jgi:hypothetical protein
MRHPHKFFERLDLLPFGLDEVSLRGGLALPFGLGQRAEAAMKFVVNVFRDKRHFLNGFLLVVKFWKRAL